MRVQFGNVTTKNQRRGGVGVVVWFVCSFLGFLVVKVER